MDCIVHGVTESDMTEWLSLHFRLKDQVFYEGKRLSLASQGLLPHWMLEGRRLAAVGWFQRGEKALALSIPARVTTTLPEEKGHTKNN